MLMAIVLKSEYSISYFNQTVESGMCISDIHVIVDGDAGPFEIALMRDGVEVSRKVDLQPGNHL